MGTSLGNLYLAVGVTEKESEARTSRIRQYSLPELTRINGFATDVYVLRTFTEIQCGEKTLHWAMLSEFGMVALFTQNVCCETVDMPRWVKAVYLVLFAVTSLQVVFEDIW